MSKFFPRIVAALLVPCLLMDPALAVAQNNPSVLLNSVLFSQQALIPNIVSEQSPSVSHTAKLAEIQQNLSLLREHLGGDWINWEEIHNELFRLMGQSLEGYLPERQIVQITQRIARPGQQNNSFRRPDHWISINTETARVVIRWNDRQESYVLQLGDHRLSSMLIVLPRRPRSPKRIPLIPFLEKVMGARLKFNPSIHRAGASSEELWETEIFAEVAGDPITKKLRLVQRARFSEIEIAEDGRVLGYGVGNQSALLSFEEKLFGDPNDQPPRHVVLDVHSHPRSSEISWADSDESEIASLFKGWPHREKKTGSMIFRRVGNRLIGDARVYEAEQNQPPTLKTSFEIEQVLSPEALPDALKDAALKIPSRPKSSIHFRVFRRVSWAAWTAMVGAAIFVFQGNITRLDIKTLAVIVILMGISQWTHRRHGLTAHYLKWVSWLTAAAQTVEWIPVGLMRLPVSFYHDVDVPENHVLTDPHLSLSATLHITSIVHTANLLHLLIVLSPESTSAVFVGFFFIFLLLYRFLEDFPKSIYYYPRMAFIALGACALSQSISIWLVGGVADLFAITNETGVLQRAASFSDLYFGFGALMFIVSIILIMSKIIAQKSSSKPSIRSDLESAKAA